MLEVNIVNRHYLLARQKRVLWAREVQQAIACLRVGETYCPRHDGPYRLLALSQLQYADYTQGQRANTSRHNIRSAQGQTTPTYVDYSYPRTQTKTVGAGVAPNDEIWTGRHERRTVAPFLLTYHAILTMHMLIPLWPV